MFEPNEISKCKNKKKTESYVRKQSNDIGYSYGSKDNFDMYMSIVKSLHNFD